MERIKVKKEVKTNTLRIIRDREGNELYRQLFDMDNNLLERLEVSGKRIIYKYNQFGKLMYEKTTNNNFPDIVTYYKYDEFGNAIFSTTTQSEYRKPILKEVLNDGSVKYNIGDFECICKYNDNNQIAEFYNPKTKYRQVNVYNDKDLLIGFSDTNQLTEKYEYDESNNVIKVARTLKKTQSYTEWYTYDNENRVTHCKTSSDKEEIVSYEKYFQYKL